MSTETEFHRVLIAMQRFETALYEIALGAPAVATAERALGMGAGGMDDEDESD